MREIPYPQWADFLNQFGYRHFAWNVTLVHKLAGRDKLIENDCFLEEFVTGHVDGHEQITIVLGSPFRPFQSCVIENPCHLRITDTREHALEIESRDGSSIVVRLRRILGA
jgi:hypothetical protein